MLRFVINPALEQRERSPFRLLPRCFMAFGNQRSCPFNGASVFALPMTRG
jgi:hypothetical protein